MSVIFTLKYIIGLSIFVSGSNEESKNGALNVVDFSISHHSKRLNHTGHIKEEY